LEFTKEFLVQKMDVYQVFRVTVKNPLNRASTGPDKMSGLERIPVYRAFSYVPIHILVHRHSNYSLHSTALFIHVEGTQGVCCVFCV